MKVNYRTLKSYHRIVSIIHKLDIKAKNITQLQLDNVASFTVKSTNMSIFPLYSNLVVYEIFSGNLISCCCGLLKVLKVRVSTSGWQPVVTLPSRAEQVRRFLEIVAKIFQKYSHLKNKKKSQQI